ncbi:hypothetical protein PVAP13_2NG131106 [Panicum virgatum]|uniref:Uncharacterized protein n=1 Tax=Panicum virgatum TaxID=38727 RepID=A0A8T0VCH8_PANVG|nr:hypothetical protein PVAP13_2NG131106 [Panicum virgatum]
MPPTDDANAGCKMHRRKEAMQSSLLRCIHVRVEDTAAPPWERRGRRKTSRREKGKKEDELNVVPHRRASLLGLSDVPGCRSHTAAPHRHGSGPRSHARGRAPSPLPRPRAAERAVLPAVHAVGLRLRRSKRSTGWISGMGWRLDPGEPVGVAGFGRGLLLLLWRTGTPARPRTSASSSPSSPRATAAPTTPVEMQRSVGDGAVGRKDKILKTRQSSIWIREMAHAVEVSFMFCFLVSNGQRQLCLWLVYNRMDTNRYH